LAGGALAPTDGAIGVVVFGRCAPEPGMPALAPVEGLRFGSLGLGVEGAGGVIRDIGVCLSVVSVIVYRFIVHPFIEAMNG
jgi:hypothetical protein